MTSHAPTLRPILPADLPALVDVFVDSIEELTQDDYDEEQRTAWIASAEDEETFGKKLARGLTILAELDGEVAGFAMLEKGTIEMLYVHSSAARSGVASALCDALERLAAARGVKEMTVEASDTAFEFFRERGYEANQRNSVERVGVWLANTTMKKPLVLETTQ